MLIYEQKRLVIHMKKKNSFRRIIITFFSLCVFSVLAGIHTSINKGTIRRNCHQDWLLGRCGRSQSGAGKAPKGYKNF